MVMIDSGASHNFVSRMLVEKLGMRVDWLTLGEVRVDWGRMMMIFIKAEQEVVLQGDPALQRSVISLCSIANTSEVEFCVALFSTDNSIEKEKENMSAKQPTALQNILLKYAGVFENPQGLPPDRGQNHSIRINVGCGPVQVRPYR